MLSKNPTIAQPPAPPSEALTSALPICPKSASDMSMPSKHTDPIESSSVSLAKKKKEHEQEKKSIPKEAAHKSYTLHGAGKQVGSALSPLQRAQPDIVAPPIPELMVLPPIKLMDSPTQQLDPPISEASVATRPKLPVKDPAPTVSRSFTVGCIMGKWPISEWFSLPCQISKAWRTSIQVLWIRTGTIGHIVPTLPNTGRDHRQPSPSCLRTILDLLLSACCSDAGSAYIGRSYTGGKCALASDARITV
ncbi:UNVERIFIED_CONTAM: hypothetical protein K2H54_056810 [Gekko kuhli]